MNAFDLFTELVGIIAEIPYEVLCGMFGYIVLQINRSAAFIFSQSRRRFKK